MKASHPTRILTCCYCGARSTLPRQGRTKLVCHGCGAAIRRIESLQPVMERQPRRPDSKRPAVPHPADRPERSGGHKPHDRPARRRKGKRRKSIWKRLEDQVEDLLDIFDLD